MTVPDQAEYRIPDFHELEPTAARQRLCRLLRQRGACLVPLKAAPGIIREARQEVRRQLLSDQLKRTPRQVLAAYYGDASAWTMELSPPGGLVPEGKAALAALDAALQPLAVAVAQGARQYLERSVSSRSAALLHVPREDPQTSADSGEEETSYEVGEDDVPINPEEAWHHLLHCAQRKVVLLFSFQPSRFELESRNQLGKPMQFDVRRNDVFIYLHDACFLRVLESGPLLQVDLKIEATKKERSTTHQGLLEIPKSLVQQYTRLLESIKDLPSEEVGLPALRDSCLTSLGGVRIASLKVELPSISVRGSGPAPLAACLLGGLDTAAPVVAPPPLLRSAHERQFYGAKWDSAQYYSPEGEDGSKMYCKHLSVLNRSYGIADFDYRYFGIPATEAHELDPGCRLLLEGHSSALAAVGQRDARSRPFGVFCGLTSRVGLPARSTPSLIVAQVVEYLGLTGPAMNLDTGDSSSLMALERAVTSIRKAECEAAMASTVNFMEGPWETLAQCRSGRVSRSGKTRVFDAAADGFVPGEGVVVCMLGNFPGVTPDAERLVVGFGSKFSGKAARLNAPHAASVTEVLAKAARDCAVPLAVLDSMEASASGVVTGDATELALIRRELKHRDGLQPVVISSAKASFGHAGPASGLVGVARSLLLLGRGLHGPQLHLRALAAEPEGLSEEHGAKRSLQIPTEVITGRTASQLLGVSSFGSTGTYAHHILLAEPVAASAKAGRAPEPLWWPAQIKKQDRSVLMFRGYFLQGTMTAWSEGMPMTRLNEEDEMDLFEGYIGLAGDYAEKFQIWMDDDPDKVLHPPSRGDASEAPVLGPARAPRFLCWQIGEGGKAGDGYRIRLQVNGKSRRLCWTKLCQDVGRSLSWTIRPHDFSIIGDHNAWTFEAMQSEPDGSFSAELQLLKAFSNFQIFRDADFEQGLYPAHGAMEKAAGAASIGEAVEIGGQDILGPDPHGYGLNFKVSGEVGDIFRVVLQRQTGSLSVSWKRVDWRPVDFAEIVKAHTYYVAGSWDSFSTCQEMERDAGGNWSVEVSLQKSVETFQILLNRNWLATVHPDISRAGSEDVFRVEGPDEVGDGKYFCLGTAKSDRFEPGSTAMIHLEIQDGFPSRVWWARSDSDRAHELRISAGLERYAERHLRLLGLIPYDEETHTEPHTKDPPEWWNEGHVQFKFITEQQERIKQAAARLHESMDTPEKQLHETRRQLASLA